MLRFVTGFTGSGKSAFATGVLLDELVNSNRCIATNLAVRVMPWVNARGEAKRGISEALIKIYGTDFDVRDRLFLLEDERQIQQFFNWRVQAGWSRRGEVPKLVRIEGVEEKRFVMSALRYEGMCYVIDEAHESFRQADWASIGPVTQSWASQNRRAGDDAWLLTQQCELVAKPFRRQSVECYWLTNHKHLSVGIFRQPDYISYEVFTTTPPDNEPAIRSGRLSWKREILWDCYETVAGAGVSGSAGDVKQRAPGLHWSWIFGIAGIVMVLITLLFAGCREGLKKAVNSLSLRDMGSAVAPVVSNRVPAVSVRSPATGESVARRTADHALTLPAPKEKPVVARSVKTSSVGVVSWFRGSAGILVTFDDGVTLLVDADKLERMGREVRVDGVVYPIVAKPAK